MYGRYCCVCGGSHHVPAEQTRKNALWSSKCIFFLSLSMPLFVFFWRVPIPYPDLSCPVLCPVLSCPVHFSLSSSRYFLSGWCCTVVPSWFSVSVCPLMVLCICGLIGFYRYLEGLVSTEGGWTRRGCQHILLS